jgi:hypothetical protein
MGKISEVRSLLQQAKEASHQVEVIDLIDQAIAKSYREYRKIAAPPRSNPMTLQRARQIIETYKANPKLSCVQIANLHGVNPGRVSELISGKHSLQKNGALK